MYIYFHGPYFIAECNGRQIAGYSILEAMTRMFNILKTEEKARALYPGTPE